MYLNVNPLFLSCRTPLHAGSGSDLGIVDLPIQREKHTRYPKIESSSLKGALRQSFSHNSNPIQLGDDAPFATSSQSAIELAFGPSDGDKNAGALGFSDARILLFPVKSLKQVFTWITCPSVLNRFRLELSELCLPAIDFFPNIDFESLVDTVSDAALCIHDKITLEEFTIPVRSEVAGTQQLAQQLAILTSNKTLKKRLAIVSDDLFSFFVEYATAVITRVKIGDNGTVEHGPFNEEYLPTETVLYSHIFSSRVFANKGEKGPFTVTEEDQISGIEESDKLSEYFRQGLPKIIQLGANASLAKGLLGVNTSHFQNYFLNPKNHG